MRSLLLVLALVCACGAVAPLCEARTHPFNRVAGREVLTVQGIVGIGTFDISVVGVDVISSGASVVGWEIYAGMKVANREIMKVAPVVGIESQKIQPVVGIDTSFYGSEE
jgi:hypothetical protein